jgi:hypothetical protein
MIDSVTLSSGEPKRTLAESPFGAAGEQSTLIKGGAQIRWIWRGTISHKARLRRPVVPMSVIDWQMAGAHCQRRPNFDPLATAEY